MAFLTNNTDERVRITSSGNVGIMVTDPDEVLEVNGAIHIGTTANTNAGTIRWNGTNFQGYDGSTWKALDVQAAGGAGGWTDGGTDVYLTTLSDNVGIGNNAPSEKLEVTGNVKMSGNAQIGTEVNRTAQGSADLIPIAYGVVSGTTALSGSGNFTITNPSTGSYYITITGEAYNSDDYTTIATARNSANARIVSIADDGSGKLRVRMWTSGGVATNNTFHFIVYKP